MGGAIFRPFSEIFKYSLLGSSKLLELLKSFFEKQSADLMIAIIEETIKAFVEEDRAYWLKLYHFAGEIDTAVFNRLQAEHTKYFKELDELDNS